MCVCVCIDGSAKKKVGETEQIHGERVHKCVPDFVYVIFYASSQLVIHISVITCVCVCITTPNVPFSWA